MINLTCTCWWMNEYYIKFAWWVLVQCPELFYIHPSPPTHTHKCTPMYNLIIWHSCYFGTWGSSVHNFWLIYWFCDFYLQLSGPYRAHQDIKIASQDPKMSKTGIAGKRKHVTSNNSSETLNNQKAWKWHKLKRGHGFIWHWIANCIQYKGIEGPITVVYGIQFKCEEPFQASEIEAA